jgi:hypothetical protein
MTDTAYAAHRAGGSRGCEILAADSTTREASRALRTYEWLSRTDGCKGGMHDITRGAGRTPAASFTRTRLSVCLTLRTVQALESIPEHLIFRVQTEAADRDPCPPASTAAVPGY